MKYHVVINDVSNSELIHNFIDHKDWFKADVSEYNVGTMSGDFVISNSECSDTLFFKICKVLATKNISYTIYGFDMYEHERAMYNKIKL